MVSATETVMQMYGGIGNTWEHIAHFYARRVLLSLEKEHPECVLDWQAQADQGESGAIFFGRFL